MLLSDMRTWVRQSASFPTSDNTQVDLLINEAYRDFCRDAQTSPRRLSAVLTAGDATYDLDALTNASAETQRISIVATGGTLTATFSGQTTAATAWNASAATWVANLEALSNIAVGEVSVVVGGTGSAADPRTVDVTFTRRTNTVAMNVTGTLLTGPNAGATILTTVTGGARGVLRLLRLAVANTGERPSPIDIIDYGELLELQEETSDQGRPWKAAVFGLSSIELWPTPDAAVTLSGVYVPRPAPLAVDGDIPEVPIEYHRTIVYRAVQLALEWDRQSLEDINTYEQAYLKGVGSALAQRKRMSGTQPKLLRPHQSARSGSRPWSFRREVGLD